MVSIPTTISIDETRYALLQDLATEAGKSVESYCSERLSEGANLSAVANDRANQVFWSMVAAGSLPSEVLAESAARAKAVAAAATAVSA